MPDTWPYRVASLSSPTTAMPGDAAMPNDSEHTPPTPSGDRHSGDSCQSSSRRTPGSTKPPTDTEHTGEQLSERSLTFGLSPSDAHQHDPMLGLVVEGVVIESFLAEGGMGRVYVGHQQQPARRVAVKVMRAGRSAATIERFRRESEVLGRLSHPGIVRLFFSGSVRIGLDDVPFVVMEYVADADTLVRFCDRQQLSIDDRLRLFLQICEAVSYGHEQGVVHRDLKPSNLLITEPIDTSPARARLIDFGVAKLFQDDELDLVTKTGEFVGTRQYMSPEQFGGGPDSVDTRTDIYSLGVVLFELIAGRLPYDVAGCTLSETAQIVRHTPPRPLEMAAIPEPQRRLALARVISTCLQKKPARRYARVSELSTDLRDILRRAPLRRRRRPGRFVRVAAIVAVFMLLAAVGWIMQRPPPDALPTAASPNASELLNRDATAAASSTARWSVSPLEADWKDRLVSLEGLELHTIAGPFPRTGLRPITPGVEGSVVFRFDAPFPIDSARLRAEAVVWSAGDPIPYDPLARTAVDVSPNGRDWTTLNVRDAQRGGGFFMGDDITSIVHNSREVWIRGRVRSSVDWPGEGMIHAQFLHTTDEADTPPLVLEAYAAEASDNSLAAEQVHGARGQ